MAAASFCENTSQIPVWSGLADKISGIDLLICDLWGVMHDGIDLFPAAQEAIRQARASGVATIFLSNAPRPRAHVRRHLSQMGLCSSLLDNVVTSGGLARDYVRANCEGKTLYHLGPASDHNTVAGLPVRLVSRMADADVILATDLDHPSVEWHRPYLEEASARGVPFLCANPDRIVHVGERLYPCAGAVADLYARLGGTVVWFGKPTPQALKACVTEAGLSHDTVNPDRVLMVGDSLQTDIGGARAAGFKSLLITSGIHRADIGLLVRENTDSLSVMEVLEKHPSAVRLQGAGQSPVIPDAIMAAFNW